MKKRFLYWITLLSIDICSTLWIPKSVYDISFLIFLGIFLILYGTVLNILAGRTLKLYAHHQPKRGFSAPDKFIDIGIYSCMRHPGLFGNMFILLGVACISTKILALLFAGWLLFLALAFILFIEEKEALQKFGQKYCDYIRTTPPFAFGCLIKGYKAIKR